jgi:hypothetical protein
MRICPLQITESVAFYQQKTDITEGRRECLLEMGSRGSQNGRYWYWRKLVVAVIIFVAPLHD